MKLIKKINTSAALALDSDGREIVVLGKGIGFPQMPYELDDMSKIERTFYDVDPKYLDMIADMPQAILVVSANVAELAHVELECDLNPNLPFTLADHLNFAHQRLKNGLDLTMPIAYDIEHLYPHEYELGLQALDMLQREAGIVLPKHEAVNVAMHLINARAETGNLHSVMKVVQIIGQVESIVEEQLHFKLDKDSYNYSRFVMHLRYLIQRLSSGAVVEKRDDAMLRSLARTYPDIYTCALKVTDYLKGTWGWDCGNNELVYLILHIYRVYQRAGE